MMCNKNQKEIFLNMDKFRKFIFIKFKTSFYYLIIPRLYHFKASGIWINQKLFYVQRIYEPEAPNEIKVNIKCNKTIVSNEKQENNIQDLDNPDENKKL